MSRECQNCGNGLNRSSGPPLCSPCQGLGKYVLDRAECNENRENRMTFEEATAVWARHTMEREG